MKQIERKTFKGTSKKMMKDTICQIKRLTIYSLTRDHAI